MPQLPQVERTRRFLQQFLLHSQPKCIQKIELFNSSIIKQIDPLLFQTIITGQKFTEVGRYGKFLFLKLQTHTIISHLKLQGKYRLRKNKMNPKKHEHIHFDFDDGSSMAYCDVIRLGSMHLVPKGEQMEHSLLKKMGPEVNKPNFTTDYFYKKCKGRKMAIKQVLLDQKIVSGIGNKWADEILYQAKIHPETEAGKLLEMEVEEIVIVGKRIISKAATTSRRFTRIKAYNKTGRPCQRCPGKIRKIKVGQRSAHFCPQCQVKK